MEKSRSGGDARSMGYMKDTLEMRLLRITGRRLRRDDSRTLQGHHLVVRYIDASFKHTAPLGSSRLPVLPLPILLDAQGGLFQATPGAYEDHPVEQLFVFELFVER